MIASERINNGIGSKAKIRMIKRLVGKGSRMTKHRYEIKVTRRISLALKV